MGKKRLIYDYVGFVLIAAWVHFRTFQEILKPSQSHPGFDRLFPTRLFLAVSFWQELALQTSDSLFFQSQLCPYT